MNQSHFGITLCVIYQVDNLLSVTLVYVTYLDYHFSTKLAFLSIKLSNPSFVMIPLPTLKDAPKFGIASRHRIILTSVLFLSVVAIVIFSSYLPGHDAFGCPHLSLSSDITEFNHSKFNRSPTNATRTININNGAALF
ncbi:MAG: hypothetical protein WBN72_10225 [Nitrososphaeraceae archaeon]